MFALGQDAAFLKRIVMLNPFQGLDLDTGNYFIGIGPARYGTESRYVDGMREAVESHVANMFPTTTYFLGQALSFFDSGLTKIVIELGILGIFPFLLLFYLITKSVIALSLSRTKKSQPITVAITLWALFWAVLFLKAHTLLSDLWMTCGLFFCLGFLLSSNARNRTLRILRTKSFDCGSQV